MEVKLTKKQESVKLILEKNFVPINVILIIITQYYRSNKIIEMISNLFKEGYCYPIECNDDHFITVDKTAEISKILNEANIIYWCGNNTGVSPRGGKRGNFIKINFWGKNACIAIQRDIYLENLFKEWETEE
jgi:hypothetical protein